MTADPLKREELFPRLLAALVAPPSGEAEVVLVVHQPPLAVAELIDHSAGIIVLDYGAGPLATPADLRQRLGKILEAHQAGTLIVAVVGGDAEVRAALEETDRAAPDQRRLGMYHLDDAGRLDRIAGRRLPQLEVATTRLRAVAPLAAAQAPALIERGQRDREEAARFATAMRSRRPIVTYVLLAACVALFALGRQWTGATGNFSEMLFRMGANSAPLVANGEVWRLLSSAFLHGDDAHLVMNMLALYSFGRLLEGVLGWRRYLILYAAAALGGSLASMLWGKVLSVGASGALYGLMLAGFVMVRPNQEIFPRMIATQMRKGLVVMLIVNVIISFLPGIDLLAHLGGALVGFALVSTGLLTPRAGADPTPVRVLAVLAAVLMAASVATALVLYRPWAMSGRTPVAVTATLPPASADGSR